MLSVLDAEEVSAGSSDKTRLADPLSPCCGVCTTSHEVLEDAGAGDGVLAASSSSANRSTEGAQVDMLVFAGGVEVGCKSVSSWCVMSVECST